MLPPASRATQISSISAVSARPALPWGSVPTHRGRPPHLHRREVRSARSRGTSAQGSPVTPTPSSRGRPARSPTTWTSRRRAASPAATTTPPTCARSTASPTCSTSVGQYFPSDNVDTTVDPADYSGPPSQDDSHVVLPDAAFTKVLVSTRLDEQNNPTPPGNIAVNGESVSYRIRLDIPAMTSVFNGSVTDPLAAAFFIRDSASFVFYPDASSTTPGTPPAGVTFDPANNGSLVLNTPEAPTRTSTDTVQRFEITDPGPYLPDDRRGEQEQHRDLPIGPRPLRIATRSTAPPAPPPRCGSPSRTSTRRTTPAVRCVRGTP